MRKNSLKAVLNMSRLSVPAKISKSNLVLSSIKLKPDVFKNPSPSLEVVKTTIDELEAAWKESEDGGNNKKNTMRDKEAALLKIMNDVANYVEAVADGDITIIHLAGLEAKKMPTRVQNEFEVKYGKGSGTVVVRLKALPRAAYVWQYAKDSISNGTWVDAGTTLTSKITISGLAVGVTYWFRVAVIDKVGRSEFNAPISLVVV
jgi:hypothetical protein